MDFNTIGTYHYTYGAGKTPNRYIRFQRPPGQPNKVRAEIVARDQAQEKIISTLSGDRISIDRMSTSDKINVLRARRSGQPFNNLPSESIEMLNEDAQNAILSALEPEGPWRIEVTNGIGDDPRFETVVRICLFNAS